MLDAIDIAIKIHPEIKHIYIGLDYGVFIKGWSDASGNRATITQNPKLETQELGIALLCLKTTCNSIWTVIKNLSGNKKRMFYPSGKKYIFVNKKKKKDFENAWLELNNAYRGAELDNNKIKIFSNYYKKLRIPAGRLLYLLCRLILRNFILFTNPVIGKIIQTGKKSLAAISPVYDFQYPNIYTTDKIRPDMKTFFDASHCTYLVGE